VMAADRPFGEFYDFYSISPEYFGYHHIALRIIYLPVIYIYIYIYI
jgi:hypothetical protein